MFGLGKILSLSVMFLRSTHIPREGVTCKYGCNLVREIAAADVRLAEDGIRSAVEEEIIEERADCYGRTVSHNRARVLTTDLDDVPSAPTMGARTGHHSQ